MNKSNKFIKGKEDFNSFIKKKYRNVFYPIENLKLTIIFILLGFFCLRIFYVLTITNNLNGDFLFSSFFVPILSAIGILCLLHNYWFHAKYIVKWSLTLLGHFMILLFEIPILGGIVGIEVMKLLSMFELLVSVIFLVVLFKWLFNYIIYKYQIKCQKNNCYMVCYSGIFLIILVYKFIPNLNEIFIFIGTLLLAVFSAILFQIPSKSGLKIEFLNLDYEKMFQNQIFITSNVTQNHRVFKFDIHEMLPSNAENVEVYLKHRLCINPDAKRTEKSFYYAIDGRMKSEHLKIILKYDIYNEEGEQKTKYAKLKMYINKKIEQNEIIITDYFITQFYERIWFNFCTFCILSIRDRFKNSRIGIKFNSIRDRFKNFQLGLTSNFDNPLRLLKKAYKYNASLDLTKDHYHIESSYSNQKWLFHDGGYGSGKTALDYLYTSNAGYHPIHISPWEDNYDDDILYLIYDKVQPYPLRLGIVKKSTFIFLFIITCAIWRFCIKDIDEFLWNVLRIVCNWNWIKLLMENFFLKINELLGFQDNQFIFEVIILLISFSLAYICLPNIIIHFKKSTKVHQEYYITSIARELENTKKFLIIEDVDRLSVETLDQLFRVCSSISKEMTIKNRAIGLLSFSEENLRHKYEQYCSQKGIKFDFDKHFSDLENKLFYKRVFEKYSSQKSMIIYLNDTIQMILKSQKEKIGDITEYSKYWEGLKGAIDSGELRINKNFRDIQKCIGDIIDMDELDCKDFKEKLSSLVQEEKV